MQRPKWTLQLGQAQALTRLARERKLAAHARQRGRSGVKVPRALGDRPLRVAQRCLFHARVRQQRISCLCAQRLDARDRLVDRLVHTCQQAVVRRVDAPTGAHQLVDGIAAPRNLLVRCLELAAGSRAPVGDRVDGVAARCDPSSPTAFSKQALQNEWAQLSEHGCSIISVQMAHSSSPRTPARESSVVARGIVARRGWCPAQATVLREGPEKRAGGPGQSQR